MLYLGSHSLILIQLVEEYSVFDSEEEEEEGEDAGDVESNDDLTDEEKDIQEVV